VNFIDDSHGKNNSVASIPMDKAPWPRQLDQLTSGKLFAMSEAGLGAEDHIASKRDIESVCIL